MRILIVTTYYPPDTAIAAIRPYEFAKYLSMLGHSVTVIRPGFFRLKPNDRFVSDNIRILSYLGKDCDAEKYNRGEYVYKQDNIRFSFLNGIARDAVATILQPYLSNRHLNQAKSYFEKAKECLKKLSSEHFDIVFSTYGDLENVYIGQYAAKLFSAKLIQDFRDPMLRRSNITYWSWNRKTKLLEKDAIQTADLCTTVSDGLTSKYHEIVPDQRILTLYNGYDYDDSGDSPVETDQSIFSICYTGSADHPMTRKAMASFVKALNLFIDKCKIPHNKIRFIYAGSSYKDVIGLFSKYSIEDIVDNRGYVSHDEVNRIQNSSDLFLVLSWNTLQYTGVLTGKFFEGIRAKKPILSVISGDLPNSELKLINDKYHYGFCYENCNESIRISDLIKYLRGLYTEKMKTGHISYSPSDELSNKFHYKTISSELELICKNLIENT